ncbi:hypothetical protein DSUL_20265 [Desulfovibrionales bacterium]
MNHVVDLIIPCEPLALAMLVRMAGGEWPTLSDFGGANILRMTLGRWAIVEICLLWQSVK